MAVKYNVAVVGRTGDGKSTLSNSIARRLGMEHEPFSESSSALSHTHAVLRCQIDELELYDTPGLMDSGGVKQDETNIRSIVQELRGGSYVNAFLLVINEQAPRFDAGMQDAVKLIVDSFGPECLSHMGFVFTKALGGVSHEDARLTADQFASVISNRTHVPVAHMPAWQIDCHPERLAALGVPSERIAERAESAGIALDEMMRWAHAKPRFSTIGAEAAAYDRPDGQSENERPDGQSRGIYNMEFDFTCSHQFMHGMDFECDPDKEALSLAKCRRSFGKPPPNCFHEAAQERTS